jgi:HEAT repeat protein
VVQPNDEKTLKALGLTIRTGKDHFNGVRSLITMSLGSIGGEAAHEHLVEGYRRCFKDTRRYGERGYFLLALGQLGKGALELLRAELPKLDHEGDRAACALAIALAGDRQSIPALRDQLTRSKSWFTSHGMIALAMLGDESAIPLIRDILKKRRESDVLEEGALALALLRGADAAPELLQLYDESRNVSQLRAVATALGLVGNERAVKPLLDTYRDKGRRPEERAMALAALGQMADREPVPVLLRITRGLNPYVASPTVAELLVIPWW